MEIQKMQNKYIKRKYNNRSRDFYFYYFLLRNEVYGYRYGILDKGWKKTFSTINNNNRHIFSI